MRNGVVTTILAEMSRADRLHGQLTTDLVRASAILNEEAGEVAAAALGVTRQPAEDSLAHLRGELVQVAATAIRMLGAVDRYVEQRPFRTRMLDTACKLLSHEDCDVRNMAVFISGTVNEGPKE